MSSTIKSGVLVLYRYDFYGGLVTVREGNTEPSVLRSSCVSEVKLPILLVDLHFGTTPVSLRPQTGELYLYVHGQRHQTSNLSSS